MEGFECPAQEPTAVRASAQLACPCHMNIIEFFHPVKFFLSMMKLVRQPSAAVASAGHKPQATIPSKNRGFLVSLASVHKQQPSQFILMDQYIGSLVFEIFIDAYIIIYICVYVHRPCDCIEGSAGTKAVQWLASCIFILLAVELDAVSGAHLRLAT